MTNRSDAPDTDATPAPGAAGENEDHVPAPINAGVPATRSIELEIEIDAPSEAIWRAITEAEELVRWFPMEAEVEPGEGGRVWVSWGDGMSWSSRIAVWEPGHRLRSIDEPPPGAPPMPVEVALEYEIEGRGGRSVLRLTHSGFSPDAEWDQYIDSVTAGWTYFLRNLKHYLERHRGVARNLIKWRRPLTVAAAEAWRMLADPSALGFANAQEGTQWKTPLLPGVAPGGEVWMVREPHNFACTIESLNDAVLFIEMEPGGEVEHCGVWLSTYGLPEERVRELEAILSAKLEASLTTSLG
jgi:uncharacterized protein YndB with AHSA1/START domain